jgi:hypothetical protein
MPEGWDFAAAVRLTPAAPARAARRLDETVVDITFPRGRPYYVPDGEPQDSGRLAAAGPVPPATCLRAIDLDGSEADQMPLRGLPAYLGTDSAWPNVRYAGVVLSDGAGGLVMLDSCDPAWWSQLIEEAVSARDALLAGSGTARTPA